MLLSPGGTLERLSNCTPSTGSPLHIFIASDDKQQGQHAHMAYSLEERAK